MSFTDIYRKQVELLEQTLPQVAGKACFALKGGTAISLFDVRELLCNEGLSPELINAIVVYLISHDHAPDKLLAPKEKDISHEYKTGFVGMTECEVPLVTLVSARESLVAGGREGLTNEHKKFLIPFYLRQPEWKLLPLQGGNQLPAVKWREMNLDRAGPETRNAIVKKLEDALSG